MPSDIELINQYFNGDEKSLEILIKNYLGPVYRFVCRFAGDNAAAAEDVVQETFFKMWLNLKKYDQKRNFKTWLFSIAKNAALDYLKKKKAIPFSEFDAADSGNKILDALADPSLLIDEILAAQDAAQKIHAVIAKLPLAQRLVFLLRAQADFKFCEIADLLGEPTDTVKSRYRRSLIALRNLINKSDGR